MAKKHKLADKYYALKIGPIGKCRTMFQVTKLNYKYFARKIKWCDKLESNIIQTAHDTVERNKVFWGSAVGGQPSKEEKAVVILAENRAKGRAAEREFFLWAKSAGYEVERVHTGADFKLYKTDPYTGKKTFKKYVEIKSSDTAPLSELQKQMQKKYGPKYKVVRYPPSLY